MLERLFSGKHEGFYIDIGAAHPSNESVTCHFYNKGWTGINVEPQVGYFKALEKARPKDINLCMGIGARIGDARFYQTAALYLSTCDPDSSVLDKQEHETRTISITTLADLCHKYVKRPIDFLKIDVEGWEKDVLQGGDWKVFRPIVVVVEATKPNSQEPAWHDWEPDFLSQGYQLAYFDGLNRFYLRAEDAALRHFFATPPNVFDAFVSYELDTLRRTAGAAHASRTPATSMRDLQKLLGDVTRQSGQVTGALLELAKMVGQGDP